MMTDNEELVERDHERIWLEPECCSDPSTGRQWCQDPVWPTGDCPEDAPGTEYVRADLFEQLHNRVERLTVIADAAHAFVQGGTRITQRVGIVHEVIEKPDHSDPHYKLCGALEGYEPRAALTGEHNG